MKLCVLFPGIGYTVDKPLLYYLGKYARSRDYEIISIKYKDLPKKVKGDSEKMKLTFDMAIEQTKDQLKDVEWSKYEHIIFIGKSIGTAIAAAFGKELKSGLSHSLDNLNINYILLTPLKETFLFIDSKSAAAFHGTSDPWAETPEIEGLASKLDIPLYEYANANHSLETGDFETDINYLKDVFSKCSPYFIYHQ